MVLCGWLTGDDLGMVNGTLPVAGQAQGQELEMGNVDYDASRYQGGGILAWSSMNQGQGDTGGTWGVSWPWGWRWF